MEPFIGELRLFPWNWAPRGWSMCNGQILPIDTNQVLFSLIGKTYGGDGRTTFALPDLRGRVPMHQGTGTGLPEHKLGEQVDPKLAAGSDTTAQPSLVMNWCIAVQGVYPSRN